MEQPGPSLSRQGDKRPHSALAVILAGLLATVLPDRAPELLATTDLARELEGNAALRASSAQRQDEALEGLRAGTRMRARLLRAKTARSFILILSAVPLAWLADTYLPWPLLDNVPLLTVLSVFAFAWATVGRLGWEGQTIAGTTAIERVDAFIFRAL